jgi:hypothetical protein
MLIDMNNPTTNGNFSYEHGISIESQQSYRTTTGCVDKGAEWHFLNTRLGNGVGIEAICHLISF